MFWTICLRRNAVGLCHKQDSLMRDTAAFVCNLVEQTDEPC